MSIGKAVGRWLRRLLVGALALATFAIIATFLPRPLFGAKATDGDGLEIFVATNPIHSDIIIPFDEAVKREFAFLRSGNGATWFDNPNVRYISFGRGGRSFYIETPTWDQLKPMPVLKGLTLDNAAMHVEPLGEINRGNPSVIALSVSVEDLEALRKEIRDSFANDAGNNPVLIEGASYGAFDDFYEANGHFNALLGCNTWTARMLRTAGLRTGIWNPLPQSLRLSLNLYN